MSYSSSLREAAFRLKARGFLLVLSRCRATKVKLRRHAGVWADVRSRSTLYGFPLLGGGGARCYLGLASSRPVTRVTAILRTKWSPVHGGGRFDRSWRRFMASLKDRAGYGDGSQGSHNVVSFLSSPTWWVGSGCSLRSRLPPRPWEAGGCVRALRGTCCGDPWSSDRLRRSRSLSTMTASRK